MTPSVQTPPSSTLVLVVEDDPAMQQAIRRRLESYGLEVLTCRSVIQGLSLLQMSRPVAAIFDLNLTDGYGFELVRQTRERCPTAKIFVMTAYAGSWAAREAQRLGVDGFFEKPVPRAMLEVLRELGRPA
jgi:ActR/RegA family two-component response regulator